MRLQSLPVRGTTEPTLLLLIDSATDFTLELVSFEDWSAIVDRGEAVPPDYPFGTLPILTFGHGARGGSDSHVSEPSAILTFLEGKLSPLGSARRAPDALARLEMLRAASSHLLHTLLARSSSPTWLSPPHREPLFKLCTNYLASLSYHLSSSFFPPLLNPPLPVGSPGTSLTAAAATASTVVSLIEDIFPGELGGAGGMARRWPKVDELRNGVEGRARIKAWREGRGKIVGGMEWEWAEGEFATKRFMTEKATKWGRDAGVEEGSRGAEEEMVVEGELVDII